MKQKIIMLLAVMLLGSASAFAQSGNNEPLKGDVNEDGKVDVADIAAVIKIMKDGGGTSEETKYYFSVGTTPITIDNYTTANNATTDIPSSTTFSTTVRNYGYILAPENKTVTVVDDADNAPIPITEQTSISIPNHKVYKTNGALGVGGTIKITLSPVYYFYVGTEKPTSLSYPGVTTVSSYPAEQIFTNTGTSKCYVYVLTNADKTVNIYDAAMPSIPLTKMEDMTSIPGYKITTPSGDGINPSKLGINGQDIIRIE